MKKKVHGWTCCHELMTVVLIKYIDSDSSVVRHAFAKEGGVENINKLNVQKKNNIYRVIKKSQIHFRGNINIWLIQIVSI